MHYRSLSRPLGRPPLRRRWPSPLDSWTMCALTGLAMLVAGAAIGALAGLLLP